jgi:hypothetical protein
MLCSFKSQFKRELVEDKQLELSANNANLKEGDIFVHEQGDSNRVKRKIVGEFDAKTRVSMRWPNNIVVYEIANDFRNFCFNLFLFCSLLSFMWLFFC